MESQQQGRTGGPHGASRGEEDEEGDHQTEEPPMASDGATPRMAQEKSYCLRDECLRDGFLA